MTRRPRFLFRWLAVSRRLATALACVAALTSAHAEAADPKIDESYLALLAHPDLSSPRATLASLQESVQQAYQVLSSAYDEYRHNPGFRVSAEVKRQVTTAQLLLRRAIATLDLSQVPEVDREEVGTQTVLLLKEILDRLPVTPAEGIPGQEDVTGGHGKPPIKAWSLPYAQIQIVRVSDGPEAGNYLFSASTVAGVPELFNLIKGFSERASAGPEIVQTQVRVRFRELGQYALGVELYTFVKTTDSSHFLEIQEGLLLAIMKIVEECGTAMALPSNTTYHVLDGGPTPSELRDVVRRYASDAGRGAGVDRLSGSAA